MTDIKIKHIIKLLLDQKAILQKNVLSKRLLNYNFMT